MRVCAFACGFAVLLVSAAANAQDERNRALGEALFSDAKRLMDAGELDPACPKFDDSYRAYPGTGTLLNAAACYEQAGKFATAWSRYAEAAAAARRDNTQERVRFAEERRAALEPKLSRLQVQVGDALRSLPGLEVRVNGVTLPASAFGLAVPTDAGQLTVVAAATGKVPREVKVSLAVAAEQSVVIDVLEDAAPPPKSSAPPPPPSPAVEQSAAPEKVRSSSSAQRTAGFVVAGAGLVGLGVGVVFNVLSRGSVDDADQRCSSGSPAGRCDVPSELEWQAREDDLNRARNRALVSYVGLGVGAAALGIGAALIFTAPSDRRERAVSIVPQVSPDQLGLSVGGAL